MGIIPAGKVYIFVVPDYFDWCVFECLFWCWLEFPSKFIQCIPDAGGKVEEENESEGGRMEFTRTFKCSQQRELRTLNQRDSEQEANIFPDLLFFRSLIRQL